MFSVKDGHLEIPGVSGGDDLPLPILPSAPELRLPVRTNVPEVTHGSVF